MNSKLDIIPTGEMSQTDWLAYRKSGIGASEVGTIMGLNPYKSSIELFYEKIGDELYSTENIAQFLGKENEPLIAKMWEHWDGTEDGMLQNFRNGTRIRRCRRINAYVRNPEYPWLFVSLDRVINRTEKSAEGALELKMINGYEVDKWEGGIPPSHVVQVQTQLLVCKFTFGELATLQDNRRFTVLPFEIHEEICQGIIDRTREFWEKVMKAREILTQQFEHRRNFNYQVAEEMEGRLHDLEPAPDGTQAYSDFLKKKFKIAEPGERMGTLEELAVARELKRIKEGIKTLEEQSREKEDILRLSMRQDFDKLDFGQDGYVSWKADVKGTRRLLNKVKND